MQHGVEAALRGGARRQAERKLGSSPWISAAELLSLPVPEVVGTAMKSGSAGSAAAFSQACPHGACNSSASNPPARQA
ncbi:hypothetical protein [Achromobacter aegrifaciens]|uniref:hypothetical protein n=1 Tax=Achromobacter aegrifaciens TaxID=1287736 RepID=UPI0028A98F76|nr:hypothetical protein [Achromobacter aegrifaciens]